MSRLYDVVILGEDRFESWLLAAAAARLDYRVALIFREPPDPELPRFFELPFDPARVSALAAPFGLAPTAAPSPAYLADLQVILSGRAFDLVADPDHQERQLGRDFQELAPRFRERSEKLGRLAEDELAGALERGFPELAPPSRRSLIGWLKSLTARPEAPLTVGEWAGQETPLLIGVFMATAAAALGAPLGRESPALQLALAWQLVRGLNFGPGSEQDFREQAAALISRRGAVLEAEPEALIAKGRTFKSLRLRGGAIVDARTLTAPVKRLYRLLGRDPDPASDSSLRGRVPLMTSFFRIEKTVIPESLAERAIVVLDPGRELSGENLLILVRGPRTPARETLAVTMLAPPPEFEPGRVPDLLARSLPWLDPAGIGRDETREPILFSRPSPRSALDQVFFPRLPLDNFVPHPAEILPAWGLLGLRLTVKAMLDLLSELIKKSKGVK